MEVHVAEHLSEISRVGSGQLRNSIWIDCRLENCHLSGVHIDSALFSNCQFQDVEFYWCFVYQASFVNCTFLRCDLRGDFHETKFVRCKFDACEVGDNNLGGKTSWEATVAVECVVIGDPLPIVENMDF